jgi:hypothetical protein
MRTEAARKPNDPHLGELVGDLSIRDGDSSRRPITVSATWRPSS